MDFSLSGFRGGLVFGFDLGTASIGYAVRRGTEFLDVGVLLCPEDLGELKDRRGLRRQRRTIRSRKQRRSWFSRELAKLVDLELHPGSSLPKIAWTKDDIGHNWMLAAEFAGLVDPVGIRVRALNGEILGKEELFTAAAHLAKRRGYLENVPWATLEEHAGEAENNGKKSKPRQEEQSEEEDESEKDDPEATRKKVEQLRSLMAAFSVWFRARNGRNAYPADLSAHEAVAHALWVGAHKTNTPLADLWAKEGMFGAAPTKEPRQRKKVWPRDMLEAEMRAIFAAQEKTFPVLSPEMVDWLLFGKAASFTKTEGGDVHHIIRRGSDPGAQDPGLFSLRWPRFDNRHPALDMMTPFDDKGRPVYVARKNKPEAKAALFEQAILNFRVTDKATGKKRIPEGTHLTRLRELYEHGRRKKSTGAKAKGEPAVNDAPDSIEISSGVLNKWFQEFSSLYQAIEGTTELKASLGTGRARFCRANLQRLHDDFVNVANGQQDQASWQPLLRKEGESQEQAKERFFSDIRHRLVQHRMRLFTGLVSDLVRKHGGKPDYVVFEAVRTLALSRKKKEDLNKERQKREKERQGSISQLREANRSTSKLAILRYRLYHEVGGQCPFCLKKMCVTDLHNGMLDIAHLYPKAWAACNEQWNMTVSHVDCNRVDMQNEIPRNAFRENWPAIEENARTRFKGKKLELFLAANREEADALVRPGGDLAQTAYISKMVRRACLIELDWLHGGRDPVATEGVVNHPGVVGLKMTNGQITASLRRGWGLDAVLYSRGRRLSEAEELALPPDERKARYAAQKEVFEKNRGDHRHHAIDAMVIACTWPARALHVHNISKEGAQTDIGWWWDAKRQQMLACHPLYADHRMMRHTVETWMERVKQERGRLKHHVSTSRKKKGYELTFLSGIRYDKKDPTAVGFYKREKVDKLTINKLLNTLHTRGANYLHPMEMGEYLRRLWSGYSRDMERYLELAVLGFAPKAQQDEKFAGKKNEEIESALLGKLCYQAFAKWQANGRPEELALPESAESAMRPMLEVMPRLSRGQDGNAWTMTWRLRKAGKKQMGALGLCAFKKLPSDFMNRLCFSAFQQWRAPLGVWEQLRKAAPGTPRPVLDDPLMPSRVVIPIKSLRVLVTENRQQLMPANVPGREGGRAMVERKEYREVRLMALKGKPDEVVPVFVPMWKGDTSYSPYCAIEFLDMAAKPKAVFRKRQIITLAIACGDKPAGNYVLLALNPSGQAHLCPPYVASTPQAQTAHGLSKSGWKPLWKTLIPCLAGGFRFPADALEPTMGNDSENEESDTDDSDL